jgi:hypothetical protein
MQLNTPERGLRAALPLSPVAAACAVLISALSAPASRRSGRSGRAADAPPTTVVVAGIRRGIEDAISVKKDATSIVESISAEDIGKLPDVSIAESIARLPGLAGQRVAGRAQVISIRGLSPDFATTLLNGREQVSTGDNRSVEFDQYPSELLSGVTVYKTPDAGLVGQGLSGTIDMQTVRPLSFSGRNISLNARGEKTRSAKSPTPKTPATASAPATSTSLRTAPSAWRSASPTWNRLSSTTKPAPTSRSRKAPFPASRPAPTSPPA